MTTDGCITTDMFNKKLKEYKEKQEEIREEMTRHDQADEKFYLTVNTVLKLAQKAREIFESSEITEKTATFAVFISEPSFTRQKPCIYAKNTL